MKIEIDVSSDTSTSQKLVIVSLPEARKLYEQLADLLSADVSQHIWPTHAGPNTTHVWSADE